VDISIDTHSLEMSYPLSFTEYVHDWRLANPRVMDEQNMGRARGRLTGTGLTVNGWLSLSGENRAESSSGPCRGPILSEE
jgi:hypothetical protein